MSLTAKIHRLPPGTPCPLDFPRGTVTYLWHRIADSYSVWFIEGDVSTEEIAEGEAKLRAIEEWAQGLELDS